MASLEPSIRNRTVLESFVYHTVTDHTEATFRIIAGLPDSDMKSTMVDHAYRQLCETNLTSAVEQLNNTDDSLQRNLALKNIGGKIGSMGMAQTLDASDHLPLDEKKILFENAWRNLTISDYQGLLSYIKDGMDSLQLPADRRDEIISMAADIMAHRNENEAIAWLDSVAGNDKPGVMKGLARTMAANDPGKLGKFLNSLPHDNAWAVGVGIMIRATETVDAKKAEPWKAALGEYNALNPNRPP